MVVTRLSALAIGGVTTETPLCMNVSLCKFAEASSLLFSLPACEVQGHSIAVRCTCSSHLHGYCLHSNALMCWHIRLNFLDNVSSSSHG